MTELRAEVLLLILAEQEDLSDPISRRWLSWCQERVAEAALSCEQALRVDLPR